MIVVRLLTEGLNMLATIVHIFGQLIFANVQLALVDDLGAGALNGLAAGAAVGAIVWAITAAPDTLGRLLLFSIVLALLMAFVQLALILSAMPEVSMASLIDAFQQSDTAMGQRIIEAGQWIGYSALGGAVVAVLFSVPGEAIKGAIIGLGLGALLGAGLNVGMRELGILTIRPDTLLFQLVIGLLTWGILASIGGR